MAAPIIAPLPTPPVRTDGLPNFDARADAFLAAFPTLQVQINASTSWIQGQTEQIEGWSTSSAQSANLANQAKQAAEGFAAQALTSRNQAQGFAVTADEAASLAGQRANAANGYAVAADESQQAAEAARLATEGLRDETQTLRDQAQAIVVGDTIDDEAINAAKLRSSLNDSIGNFRNVPMAASGAMQP